MTIHATLKASEKINRDIFEITFQLEKPNDFSFTPGQFIEIVLPNLDQVVQPNNKDQRGNRREFSIFSAPAELPSIKIAFHDTDSLFKKALINNSKNLIVEITGPYGDFILPKEINQPIYFIAGGIGITPFMSMLKDKLYTNSSATDKPKLQNIMSGGIKFLWSNPVEVSPWLLELNQFKNSLSNFDFSWQKNRIKIDDLVKSSLGQNPLFYIAGPIALVVNIKNDLLNMAVAPETIFTDEFT